jgi:hypothetical protein
MIRPRSGVPSDHLTKSQRRFAAVNHQGRITSLVAEGETEDLDLLAEMSDEDRESVTKYALEVARANATEWATANQTVLGKPDAAVPSIVDAMSDEELLDQFLDGIPAQPETTTTVTPIMSGDDLAAKIAGLRERQQAQSPDVERLTVKAVVASGEYEVDLPVRWDDEAFDPYKWDKEAGRYGANGAFVPTAEGESFAMVAAGSDAPQLVDDPGAAWHAVLCVEGLRTDEDPAREIVPDACQIPDLPISLRLQIHDEGGHYGAVTCGRIDTIDRMPLQGYNALVGSGVFGTDEHGQLAQLLVTEQTQRFISIDPRDIDMEIIEITVATGDPWDDELDTVVDWWIRYTNLTIGAATIVATPALQQAVITLASVELPETPIAVANASAGGVTVVTAAGGPLEPPAAWFDDPSFHVGDSRLVRQPDGKYACPLTISEDGHVFGHVCYWGQHHTGFRDRVVTPPKSRAALAHYLTGPSVKCLDNQSVYGVGQITMGCGHAAPGLGHAPAKAHYDGGYGAVQVADVRAGQDDFGVWISGSMRSDLTPEQVKQFRATNLSGDWRAISNNLELIAVLAGVPVQGFPISRQEALVASAEVVDSMATRTGLDHDGEVVSLVAAGRVQRLSHDERLSQLENIADILVRERRARHEEAGLRGLAALVNS